MQQSWMFPDGSFWLMKSFNGLNPKYINESPSFTKGGGGWGEKSK
jgi:hypothetical protein